MKALPVLILFTFYFSNVARGEPVESETLITREVDGTELLFLPNEKEPFNGKSIDVYENGKKWVENYKNGKTDGLSVEYYPDGSKSYEDIYKNGLIISAKSWKPDGSKCEVTNVDNGKGVAQTYHPNGKPEWKGHFAEDILMGWKLLGTKTDKKKVKEIMKRICRKGFGHTGMPMVRKKELNPIKMGKSKDSQKVGTKMERNFLK
jgi:hypothetical protein